jgi:hypothetical protein
MKTVLRLVYTYFMGTPVTRGLTILGMVLSVLSVLPIA